MLLTTKFLSAFNRRTRWSEGHVFAFTAEQIGIVEGLRASLAIAVMLIADLQLHIPDLAYGAVAAFWTCLCDPGGPDRPRLKTLATFAVGATLAISISAYGAHWGPVAGGIVLFILVLLCGLARSYRPTFGPVPSQIGLIAAIAVVVGVSSPRDAASALELAGCFLLGAVWATLLCVYVWRTDPQLPARRALIAIFVRLHDMTIRLQQLDAEAEHGGAGWVDFDGGHRRAVRLAIERGREAAARLATGRPHFSHGIDFAGHIFSVLVALGHHRARAEHPFDASVERPLVDGLRRLLHQVVQQSEKVVPDSEILVAEGTALRDEALGHQGVVAHAVAAAAEEVVALAHHWDEPEPEETVSKTVAGRFSLKALAPVWRHALRVAVAVTISYGIGAWLDVTFSYWGTIAVLVVMQPLGANTWLRVFERAVGSIVGGVLTAILIARLSGPFEMLLFIAPLSAVVIALRLVNYALFVIFLTPMFVLVSDFIHPASDLISTRAINEVIGACIGLAGSFLLWPAKEGDVLSDAVLAALTANMALASRVLGPDGSVARNLDQLRQDAGVTSTRAEIARQRLLLQGRSHAAHLDRVRDILIAIRVICGAANVTAITRQFEAGGPDEARASRYDALTKLLHGEFLGRDERSAMASFEIGGSDDLSRAVHNLVVAVQDYAAEAHGIGARSGAAAVG
ncbi:MAG TPA: FUSC family protein [Magnetospirillaceae bacterium]|jgi:uncharacterized membrane protein YccC